MSHPALWSKGNFFYPVGNTPAVDLLQDLLPEEDASVLLLGCGDPRSILYTLYNRDVIPEGLRSTFDVTCCDIEPAVLARNVLLLTLIIDNHPPDVMWNIFYHFKLDTSAFATLYLHCEKLADCSQTLDKWNSSKYFPTLRVCDSHTLLQLNRQWRLYASSRDAKADLERQLAARRRPNGQGINTMPLRAAGMFDFRASDSILPNYTHYWKTGIVDTDPKSVSAATIVNPTFFYSSIGDGRGFHYGTYPLGGYHLAEVYSSRGGKEASQKQIVDCAKDQFSRWCTAFCTAVSSSTKDRPSRIRVRFFAGHSLNFCLALQAQQQNVNDPAFYRSTWSHRPIDLNGGDYGLNASEPGPLAFNIIDTSNLVDHIGLLNVMLTAVPLLLPRPSSTFYTEAMQAYGEDGFADFARRLCADIPAFSVLFGIAPVSYLSQFSRDNNVNEVLRLKALERQQYYERIAWKMQSVLHGAVGDSSHQQAIIPHFEPADLASLIFAMYHNMLPTEDKLTMTMRNKALMGNALVHYHRGTFTSLLAFVKSRVHTDWTAFMDIIFARLHNDQQLFFGTNFYQELCGQLHIRRVFSVETLLPDQDIVDIDTSRGPFRGWKDVPPMVCMVLVIPRTDISFLEKEDFFSLGTPMLQIGAVSPLSYNIFSCAQFSFGKVAVQGAGEGKKLEIEEDSEGHRSTSDLVVSVWVPPRTLTSSFSGTKISLELHATIATMKYVTKLGQNLAVFSTGILNDKVVHFVKTRPGNSLELKTLERLAPIFPPQAPSVKHWVTIDNSLALSELRVYCALIDEDEREAFANGSKVKTLPMSMSVIRVSFAHYDKDLVFPFPVDHSKARLKIARKSGYVEVLVPPLRPFTSLNFSLSSLSPVIAAGSGAPIAWSSHRINLSKSPEYARRPAELEWLNGYLSFSFSDRERALREYGHQIGLSGADKTAVLANVKDSLHALFVQAFQHPSLRTFVLQDKERNVDHCYIFLNAIRLDLPNRNIVADCWILAPLTDDIRRHIGKAAFSKLGSGGSVYTAGDETVAWQHLLPTCVERCRIWPHMPSCEYKSLRRFPLSDDPSSATICGCGRGIGVDSSNFAWPKEFASYVTRAAISPLFAVPYLERVGSGGPPSRRRQSRSSPAASSSSNSDLDRTKCAKCDQSSASLLRCGQCKMVMYCGVNCQRSDWKSHKVICKQMKEIMAALKS